MLRSDEEFQLRDLTNRIDAERKQLDAKHLEANSVTGRRDELNTFLSGNLERKQEDLRDEEVRLRSEAETRQVNGRNSSRTWTDEFLTSISALAL